MREDKLVCYRHYVVQGGTRGQTEELGPHTWGLYTTGNESESYWGESGMWSQVESWWSTVESANSYHMSKWSRVESSGANQYKSHARVELSCISRKIE